MSDLETGYFSTLTSIAQGMIAPGTWNAGATTHTANANDAYIAAQTTQVNNKKVGLIATYEYLYAAGSSCQGIAGTSYTLGGLTCASQDWLKPSSYVWTLNPANYDSIVALSVTSGGTVAGSGVPDNGSVLPAVYLNSSVRITGGNGQVGETNSYKLSLAS